MLERLYKSIYLIRRVEEEIVRVYPQDKIVSPVHLSIGQEAVAVGVCDALRADDVAFGSYRSHAMYLAKGGNLGGMIAELYGRATGCAKGKAGSMHLIDAPAGVMGASAVVATTLPQALGYAMAMKMRKSDRAVVCFFGDGAMEEGAFHECMYYAALKQLPLLFVCENNFYAIHSPVAHRHGFRSIESLVQAYGMPFTRIESMDTLEIRSTTARDVASIRAGAGPRFIEAWCYRWREHVGAGLDFSSGYRATAECEPWQKNDQVRSLAEKLDPATRKKIESDVEAEIKDAFEFAERSPWPGPAELYTDLY